MHALMDQPIPGLSLLVLKRSIPESAPLTIKHRAAIIAAKIGLKGFFKAATEDHGSPGLLLAPAVQVAMAIATRTPQVVTDLGVAEDHFSSSFCSVTVTVVHERASHSPAGANASRFW